MHYFICAGEPSGDLHAAAIIKEIAINDPKAQFTFLGGDLMAEAAGKAPVIHYRRMAFMGFSEVLRNLRTISANLRTAKEALLSAKPDCFIAVDYPSFNLKLAECAHAAGMPVFWFIAPKVWAWKKWRLRSLRKYVDRMLCILPFETKFFTDNHVDAMYVGNPSLEEIDARLACAPSHSDFCRRHNLDAERPLLALVPGSRRGEIRNNLPIMAAVAALHPELQPVIAGAPGREDIEYACATGVPVLRGVTFELMAAATAALVTSGTATLECALAATPQVVCYRANGSAISYNIMKLILTVPFVSLPNLIAGEQVIPEMLVHKCTVQSVNNELMNILPGAPGRDSMLDGYKRIRTRLGTHGAASRAASVITNYLDSRAVSKPDRSKY